VQGAGRPVPRHRPIDRGRTGVPLGARAVLIVSLLVLCGAVMLVAGGALRGGASALGAAAGGLAAGILDIGRPSPTVPPISAAPRLIAPDSAATNKPEWTVKGRLPNGVAGRAGHTIRIYVNGELVARAPVPATPEFAIANVPIPAGRSHVHATVAGPGGESEPSLAYEVDFDDVPPEIQVTAPAEGAKVNGPTVTVKGVTQPDSGINIQNERTSASVNGRASATGAFSIAVPIGKGANGLTITVADPAGNRTSTVVSIVQGDGQLTAKLTLSTVRLRLDDLPTPLGMEVRVLDPDGLPVDGAEVTFTWSPPGQGTGIQETVTVAGTASHRVTIPRDGSFQATGFVTVRVVLPDGRTVEASEAFTVL
jgi:hypothetical protein